MAPDRQTKWLGLALICLVQFMVVLDIAIVNVALPSIQVDLGFDQSDLQWVISAYSLAFGGFLLLGGRVGDLVGRRRVFAFGLALFTIGSLLCGLAWSDTSLIASRGIQGLGAAALSPAALAILTSTFAEGRERNIALGVWGAVGGFGAAAGVLLGGILTDLLSWEWIFFVNVPVGILALVLTPILLQESRDSRAHSFDALGAVLVTSHLVLLVLAITQGDGWGWTSARTIGVFAASAVLAVSFIFWELRQEDPLVPFSVFRNRSLTIANIEGFILGTVLFSMFLLLTLYMQQVLGFSAMKTGVGYLAVAGTSVVWANVAAMTVNRIGVKPSLVFGLAMLTIGLVYFTQIDVNGSYWTDLFPGFLIVGLGMPFCFVPITIAAVSGVSHDGAGLASGLINTSQQIGGALGIAVLSTIAVTYTDDLVAGGTDQPTAAVEGFQRALWVGAAIAAVGVAVAAFALRRSDVQQSATEPAFESAGL